MDDPAVRNATTIKASVAACDVRIAPGESVIAVDALLVLTGGPAPEVLVFALHPAGAPETRIDPCFRFPAGDIQSRAVDRDPAGVLALHITLHSGETLTCRIPRSQAARARDFARALLHQR